MSINRVSVTGNLTRDPELRSTAGGTAILKIRIAVNDRTKNQRTGEWEDAPNYLDVIVFGARAEALSRMLTKGAKIAVDGKLKWSEWESAGGEKHEHVEIRADEVEFLSSKEARS